MNAYKQIIFIGFLITLFIFSTGVSVAANEPQPVAGTAVVDGNPDEWGAPDHFAELFLAAKGGADAPLATEATVLGDLYLRYDCDATPSPVLYMLVLGRDPVKITQLNTPDEHFLKLGGKTVVNGDTPQGQFMLVGVNGDEADGWEAWAAVAPGTYLDLDVHTQVNDAAGQEQTASVENRAISIKTSCDPPTAVQLSSVQAASLFDPAGLVLAIITVALLLGTTTLVLWRRQNA